MTIEKGEYDFCNQWTCCTHGEFNDDWCGWPEQCACCHRGNETDWKCQLGGDGK